MKKPRVLKWREVIALFKVYGIRVMQGRRHPILCDSQGNKYPVGVHSLNDDVCSCYIEGARRKFGLTEEDGISDLTFYQAKQKRG